MTPRDWADVQHRHPARRDPRGGRALLADLLGGAARGCCSASRCRCASCATCCIAFIPAAVIGLALHKQIEALLRPADGRRGRADRRRHRDPRRSSGWSSRRTTVGVAEIPLPTALGIGFIQCLAMIPGVSRSGATILGALTLGRRAAHRGRVQLLPRHPDDARRDARSNWSRTATTLAGGAASAGRASRSASSSPSSSRCWWSLVRRHRQPPRLRALRLVSDRRRRGGTGLADALK